MKTPVVKTNTPGQNKIAGKTPSPKISPGSKKDAPILQRAEIAPETLSPQEIMQLQRTIGNQAVCQLFEGVEKKKVTTPGGIGTLKATLQLLGKKPEKRKVFRSEYFKPMGGGSGTFGMNHLFHPMKVGQLSMKPARSSEKQAYQRYAVIQREGEKEKLAKLDKEKPEGYVELQRLQYVMEQDYKSGKEEDFFEKYELWKKKIGEFEMEWQAVLRLGGVISKWPIRLDIVGALYNRYNKELAKEWMIDLRTVEVAPEGITKIHEIIIEQMGEGKSREEKQEYYLEICGLLNQYATPINEKEAIAAVKHLATIASQAGFELTYEWKTPPTIAAWEKFDSWVGEGAKYETAVGILSELRKVPDGPKAKIRRAISERKKLEEKNASGGLSTVPQGIQIILDLFK